jgi:polyphosphate glucokinase
MSRIAIGVDVGGSGIKGAPVNLENGELTADRYRLATPQPATPDSIGEIAAKVITFWSPKPHTPIGVAFPGVVQKGVVRTAANVDPAWIGTNLKDVIRKHSGYDVHVMNDADAAGFGEYAYGAARHEDGLVLMVTLGTGIGTALISDGRLVPNSELGHLIVDGVDAEEYAAESARDRHGLGWEEWASHVDRFLGEMERLLWPDLIIIGGGVSKDYKEFLPLLHLRAPVVPAALFNNAGIVGAAAAAAEELRRAVKRAERKTIKHPRRASDPEWAKAPEP